MKERCFVGFDVGTSSLKVALASEHTGEFLDFLTFYYEMEEIFPGVSPCSMYEKTVKEILDSLSERYEIAAISVATQMYSICREIDGRMYVYQWNSLWDRKPDMEESFQADLYRSGCPSDTIFGAYKAATAPPEMKGSFVPYGIKEHLIEYLTGQLATDMTTASASGLYDISARKWNEAFVSRIGLDCGLLPQVLVHNMPAGNTKKGLLPGDGTAVVVPGLGDGMSASFACENISLLCGNLGTSMAVRRITEQGANPEESRLWTYAMDSKRYLTGGISSNGCSVLSWGKNLGFSPQEEVDTKQVMFLPWIHGERVPYWSSDLRGTFLGLSKDTDKCEIEGAVLKSVAFTFVSIVKALEEQKSLDDVLILGGGGTNSNALLSIISGCVDVDIAIMDNTDYLASIGAVMSAADGLGCKVNSGLSVQRIIKPTGRYVEEFARWRHMSHEMAKLYSVN